MAKKAAVVFAFLVTFSIAPSLAQSCPTPLGHWGYGSHNIAAWYGDLALIPSGSNLLVVDFRLGAPQSIVGEVRLPGWTIALEVQGDIAYAGIRQAPFASDELLVTIDLSDPSNPVPVGRITIARAMADIAVDGSVAFALSLSEGLVVVDVSDPARLRRLSSIPSVERAHSIVARGGYAYLGSSDGLIVVDVSDPADPFVDGVQTIPGRAVGLRLSGDRLYLWNHDRLLVFDLTLPWQPTEVGSFEPFGSPEHFDVSGFTAYISQYSAGGDRSMAVVDVTDPAEMLQVGLYPLPGRIYHLAATEHAVLVSMGAPGTQMVDVSVPTAPQLFVELPPPARPGDMNDVAVDGDLAFIADTGGLFGSTPPYGGLRIVDVSDPAKPREVSSLAFDEASRQVATNGDHVLVLRGQEEITPMTLEVVDVSDPGNPTAVGSLQFSGPPWGELVAAGDHAYVTDWGLQIVDLSDPANPVSVGHSPGAGGSGNAFTIVGDRAYLAGVFGLCIVDISDRANPVEISCTPVGGYGSGVAVKDGVAFVSVTGVVPRPRWTSTLRVLDITDEAAPTEIGDIELWGIGSRLSLDGDLLSVEVVNRGVLVLDISDPRNPATAGLARVDAAATVAGGRLYAAYGRQGLDIFDTTSCLAPAPSPDFVWSPREPILGEEVAFTDISPGAPTSWSWDFGDGVLSNEQNPRHSFTTPGRNTVTLAASNANGASAVDLTVPVQSMGDATSSSLIIPAAAHGDGKAGTRWRTDLSLTWADDEETDVVLYFMKEGEDNTLRHGRRVSLSQGVTVIEDVVATLFDEHDATGAIFSPKPRAWISSRTYTLSDDGTFGQFIPRVFHGQPRPLQELIQLTENDDFRTNLGLVNRLGTPVTIQVQLYSTDDTMIAETAYDLEPYGHRQIDGFIAELTDEPFEDGLLSLFGGPRGDFIAYASTVDNITGDPVFMLPPTATSEPLWIAAAAHVHGRNGTVWRTDLEICVSQAHEVEYRLELYESDQANPEPPSESFTLDAGHCVRYADVVRSVFDARTTGALRVVPVDGVILASSRTYTRRADGGTYGQYIAAVPESEFTSWSSYSRLAPVFHSSDPTEGFRTNVGLVNGSDSAAEVLLEVRASDHRLLHEVLVDLGPFEHRQLNGFLEGVAADGDLVDASIVVWNRTHPSKLFGYASVVDNATGDAVFMPTQ
jgi:hypothetical protein